MSIIYKPSTIYMSPNNESVVIDSGITLSFMFKGYKLYKATGQFYNKNISGEWSTLSNDFDFGVSSSNIKYNNENVSVTLTSSSTQVVALSGATDTPCGWKVSVYGQPFTMGTITSNTFQLSSVLGFNTGDKIYSSSAYTPSGSSTPQNILYIGVAGKTAKLYITREAALQDASAGVVTLSSISSTNLSAMEESIIVPFTPIASNTLTISTSDLTSGYVNKPNPTFVGTFANTPAPIIETWKAYLYDNHDNLIEESDTQYNADLSYQFDSLFLNQFTQSGVTYYGNYSVIFIASDINSYIYNSNKLELTVYYETPNVNYYPIVTNNACDSSININWEGAISNIGSSTGTITYIENYINTSGYGAKISSGGSISFNKTMPQYQLPTFVFQPVSTSFDGTIAEFTKTDVQKLIIAYDNTNDDFIYIVKRPGDTLGTWEIIYQDIIGHMTLDTTHIYLLGSYNDICYVRDLGVNPNQGTEI